MAIPHPAPAAPKLSAVWLTPSQVARSLNVSRQSVYRYREAGLIPDSMVRAAGLRKLLISSAVLPLLSAHFSAAHE